MAGQRIRVSGSVQGVGMRPTVWRLAREEGLTGSVWNDGAGVLLHAWGSEEALARLVSRLQGEPPPLARIEGIEVTPLDAAHTVPETFQIVPSRPGEGRTDIAADAATCPECLAEILDPANRRYRYPFTNCTHCGPRFSIIRKVPYDRANTSMAPFVMCPACRTEYHDPADRRFHAQPNACPECGPQLWLEDGEGAPHPLPQGEDAVEAAARLISGGAIVAIKGIGGFHLACDAGNSEAVEQLRRRKPRPHKPFALMATDLEMVRGYAEVGEGEAAMLQSSAAPVVLLQRRGIVLAPQLAPGLDTLGFMLPYTPLHHLLLHALQRPIVLTSANRSGEPLLVDNDEVRARLASVADYFLLHDREIVNRVDDSVVRRVGGSQQLLRRARGFAPQPIRLPPGLGHTNNILAMGGELKNSFCLLREGELVVSQYMGDLKDAATYRHYRESIERYCRLYGFRAEAVAIDPHPDYLSSQLGRELAAQWGVPCIAVQHHHAHIASVMAEQGIAADHGPVLGIALDGLGYGGDGTLWGGEFLLADYRGYRRLGQFEAVAVPGGNQAAREPWRNTLAHLEHFLGWDAVVQGYGGLELVAYLGGKPLATLRGMIARGINTPRGSSAGRLFDAVAAALGLCRDTISYEGQAAIELEAIAAPHMAGCGETYPYEEVDGVVGWAPLWRALLDDLAAGVAPAIIAARFHHTIARAVAETAMGLASANRVTTVVLGGGVFQNRLLLECSAARLRQARLEVLAPQRLPANDGGLALGQAVVAGARMAGEEGG